MVNGPYKMIRKSLLVAVSTLLLMTNPAHAKPNVIASIKPVHSLVSAVMKGVGTPGLIVTGAGSPHNHALKPSQASMIEKAELIFWIGPEIEAFLKKPIATIGEQAQSAELIDTPNLVKLAQRKGGAFEEHAEEHGHSEEHGHDEKHGHAEEHAQDDDHDHEEFDLHFWLDPENAKAMTRQIATVLIAADPANARVYTANSATTLNRLDKLIADVSAVLAPVQDKGFIVFHDAYQYFEKRFGVTAAGSITINPETTPGAERIREIKTRIVETNVQCVFAEPQFDSRLLAVVTEGTGTRSGVIDPLGANLKNGTELYFELIRKMAQSVRSCLS